ncbi:MAG TPA: metalloregulator ArsR/SmtB family transcription factor [Microthrixaceae bacterium]|nr:metalloregulator ArsR/SmtB family transcription factor [Microthrixaceae bacterium]
MGIRVSTMATNTTPLTVRSDETAECCPALLAEPLDPTDAVELAAVFKALADPVRLQLLSLIAAAPNATACSCDLEEPVGKSQPTVSHHLSVLADAGLITKEKVGRWVNCTIVADRLAQVRAALEG